MSIYKVSHIGMQPTVKFIEVEAAKMLVYNMDRGALFKDEHGDIIALFPEVISVVKEVEE